MADSPIDNEDDLSLENQFSISLLNFILIIVGTILISIFCGILIGLFLGKYTNILSNNSKYTTVSNTNDSNSQYNPTINDAEYSISKLYNEFLLSKVGNDNIQDESTEKQIENMRSLLSKIENDDDMINIVDKLESPIKKTQYCNETLIPILSSFAINEYEKFKKLEPIKKDDTGKILDMTELEKIKEIENIKNFENIKERFNTLLANAKSKCAANGVHLNGSSPLS